MFWTVWLMMLNTAVAGIGCLFLLVHLKTKIGPQFRYFSIQMIVLPGIAALDQFVYWPSHSTETKVLLTQMVHGFGALLIFNSVHFMLPISGRPRPLISNTFAGMSAVCFVMSFSPWMLKWGEIDVTGGVLYPWTYLPYGILFVMTMVWLLVEHAVKTPKGVKSFPILHGSAWTLVLLAALIDLIVLTFPALEFKGSSQPLYFATFLFGVSCAGFFISQFLKQISNSTSPFPHHAAHEMKNILAVIRSNTTLLQMKTPGFSGKSETESIDDASRKLEFLAQRMMSANSSNSEEH